jgi:hypothetical protein
MNTRELTQSESEKAAVLSDSGIAYELLFLTDTGLTKSILDATAPVANLLKTKHIHDYDSQSQGSEHKVMLPCIILSNGLREETKASLYRANGRGDTRFWPGRFHNFALAEQVFALFIENSNIIVLNLSDGQPLNITDGSDFSEILDRINLDSNEFIGVVGFGEDTKVENDDSSETGVSSRFEVSSYGWDSDVEGLVKRLNRGDIKLPGFQRGFVWSLTEQSRFIESLILGLPVPNIFLAQDRNSKTLNIVDGQQRLKTLQRYLAGDFPISNSKKIHEDLRGCYFNRDVAKSPKSKILEDSDERTLSDSILHSIVIKPDASSDSTEYGQEYNNAVVQIFRRLNTSGKVLQPQEVRSCIFYGPFDDLLHHMNQNESWRSLFGAMHSRYKDVETILRFLALYEDFDNYKAPMPSFLDKYMEDNRNMGDSRLREVLDIFETTTSQLLNACGETLFKTSGTLLLSKFDAVTVGFAKARASGVTFDNAGINAKIALLLTDEIYIDSTTEFINDTGNVTGRINAAIKIFEG